MHILRDLYGQVYTTPVVASEYGSDLPSWVRIVEPEDYQKQQLLELQIDPGEASAINLAIELSCDLIVLDDLKARKVSEQLQLNITGTIGLIVKAKQSGLIESATVVLDNLQETNFRISKELIREALTQAGEL
ncbi:MAG: DUF3368 domain-containing protein [Bacteroidota bacterium]